MATDRSFSSERDLLANLLAIEDGESLNEMLSMGRFKIYRFRSEPYEIVMKHVRVFTPDNPKYALAADIAKTLLESLEHKNVAKLHCVNFCSRSNLCIQQVSIETYVNYYAINLEQVIDQRKATDTRFTSGELWYLLSSLIDLALALKSSCWIRQNWVSTSECSWPATSISPPKAISRSTSSISPPVLPPPLRPQTPALPPHNRQLEPRSAQVPPDCARVSPLPQDQGSGASWSGY